MLLHDPIGDGQADAGSAKFTASRFVDAVKAFEDPGMILLRNSDSRVAHTKDGAIVIIIIARFEPEFDDSRRWGVFDCVVKEDSQQSLHGAAVG